MGLMDEFFHAHRNGKGKKHKPEPARKKRREPLDINASLFHSSPTMSFSALDIFKAGILWAEIGAREQRDSPDNDALPSQD
jgi:hypothetical protein